MCKIMSIAGVKPELVDDTWRFVVAARPYMTKSDDDGYGYAAYTKAGNLIAEKWLDVNTAYDYPEKDIELKELFGEALSEDVKVPAYDSYGEIENDITSIITHSRAATCEVSLRNVHPFLKNNIALIHNGVIRNHDKFPKEVSSCDSEAILQLYAKEQINLFPEKLSNITKQLQGYYGCMVLAEDATGRKIFDVWKHSASLFLTWVNELETIVICTSDDIIKKTCADLEFTHEKIFTIAPNTFMRFDATTGELLLKSKFEQAEEVWSTYHTSNGWSKHSTMHPEWDEYLDRRYGTVPKTNVTQLPAKPATTTTSPVATTTHAKDLSDFLKWKKEDLAGLDVTYFYSKDFEDFAKAQEEAWKKTNIQ